jgi:MFS family permease
MASAPSRLPGAVVALGLTSFFTDVGTEMIFPLLPVFLASLGAAPVFLGLVEGAADATSSLLKLVFGYVADRARRKRPLVFTGYVIATVARPLVALATAPWQVLVVRVTDRIGKGIRSAPRDALIAAAALEGEAGRAFGFHRAMDHAGAVAGPLVATALLAVGWSIRKVFWAALVPGVLAVLLVLTVREPQSDERAPDASSGARSRLPFPSSLRAYLVILALFSMGNSSDAFLLLRARDLGVPVASLPLLWSVLHVSKLFSSYAGGSFSDRAPRTKVILLGWTIYAATYLLMGMASSAWQAWALFVVYGTYHGLTEPAEKALVKDIAPSEIRGRAYGYYNFVIGATAVPAGVLTGWLWQAWGPLAAFATGASLAAVSAVALALWARATRGALSPQGDQPSAAGR